MSELRWTPEQVAIIQNANHTMVTAGPGTGKTTTILAKILWHLGVTVGVERNTGWAMSPCVGDGRFEVSQLMVLTCTQSAAAHFKAALRHQVAMHLPALLWETERAFVGTFSDLCATLLREHGLRAGLDPCFRVMDDREATFELDHLVRDVVLRHVDHADKGVVRLMTQSQLEDGADRGVAAQVRRMIRDLRRQAPHYEAWSNQSALDAEAIRSLVDAWDAADDASVELCSTVYRLAREVLGRWEDVQRARCARDRDGLIADATRFLLSKDGRHALDAMRSSLRLLVVDEFQDIDDMRRDLVFAIAGIGERKALSPSPRGIQLLAIGDPMQNIGGAWAGAVSVWNDARRDIHGFSDPIRLTENFRSDERVTSFVSRVCKEVMHETEAAVEAHAPSSLVAHVPLRSLRHGSGVGEVEWLGIDRSRMVEAEFIAARIRQMVRDESAGGGDGVDVEDAERGTKRSCSYRDVAILFRCREMVAEVERALRRYAVPYAVAGELGLSDRQEVLDLVTALRLINNPRDDLAAFAFLRSPFVGLRDEVVARMRLDGPEASGRSLLQQARDYLGAGTWFPAPEHEGVAEVERAALSRALEALDDAIRLRTRRSADQLLEEVIHRTWYRGHLDLQGRASVGVANINRFLRVLRRYPHYSLGAVVELWEAWSPADLDGALAPVSSREDDVVTLSSIHTARGAEWPVVFLADTDRPWTHRLLGTLWTDRELGPLVCPRPEERGPRAQRLHARRSAETLSQEARVMYVAGLCARDRLVIAASKESPEGTAGWLKRGADISVRTLTALPDVTVPPPPFTPQLAWLDRVEDHAGECAIVRPIRARTVRSARTADELVTARRDRQEWTARYAHGVIPPAIYAGGRTSGNGLSRDGRGSAVAVGPLERASWEAELADLLDLAVGDVGFDELQESLAPGAAYRAALEAEIRRIVKQDGWRWYVEGVHHRALPFVQLRHASKWRVGAFDVYGCDDARRWIVDFRTHDVDAESAKELARHHRVLGAVYRRGVVAVGEEPSVHLHFTKPGEAIALE